MKKIVVMIITVILAGCHDSMQRSDPAVPARSAPIFVADAETSPSEERWASLEKHMRDNGYVVHKFDQGHGNLINDLKGNPIGETVFAFFPASMSDEEIKGRIHGVTYHLNLSGKIEMRSITFRNEQLALAHQKNLLDAFASYKWKDSPIQVSAVETKDLALSLHQRTEKGEVVLDILVSNVSTATVEIVSEGIAPPWSVWAWFHWEVDGKPAEYLENVAMIPNAKETRRIPKGESILWATIPVRSLKCLTKNDQEQKEWHRAITDKKRHSITIMPGSQWQKHKLSVVQAIGNAPRENQKDFKVKSGSIDIEQKDTEPTVRGDGKPAPQP